MKMLLESLTEGAGVIVGLFEIHKRMDLCWEGEEKLKNVILRECLGN